jgi:beta-glucanase (GH16 family)
LGDFKTPATYSTLTEDWQFTGGSLPPDWAASDADAHGFQSTIFSRPEVQLTGSAAALTAINRPLDGYPHQAGWLSTKDLYTMHAGEVDFRAALPAGAGVVPALWLLSGHGTDRVEIDVLETTGNNMVHSSLHEWTAGGRQLWSETQIVTVPGLTNGFHDFQLIWQPGMMTWEVDGHISAQYTEADARAEGWSWPFDTASCYLIVDLALGAANDGFAGAPNGSTRIPSTMLLQSVRVWN